MVNVSSIRQSGFRATRRATNILNANDNTVNDDAEALLAAIFHDQKILEAVRAGKIEMLLQRRQADFGSVLPLLLGRRWRALGASTVVALAGVGLPWLFIWAFFAGAKAPVSAAYWMGTPSMFSWSVPSVVLRLLTPITRGAPISH